jgi:hypothetical protein
MPENFPKKHQLRNDKTELFLLITTSPFSTTAPPITQNGRAKAEELAPSIPDAK